jgi:hypothetical protein
MTRPGDRPPGSRGIPEAQHVKPSAAAKRGLPGSFPILDEDSLEAGHEVRDMRVRQVLGWLALLTVAVAVLIVAIMVFQLSYIGHIGPFKPALAKVPIVTPPPQPQLEQDNGQVLAALRAKENQVLNNYTWIDQSAGTVSLPIDRAIEITAQRGLPVLPQGSGQAPSSITLPQRSSSGRTSESIP